MRLKLMLTTGPLSLYFEDLLNAQFPIFRHLENDRSFVAKPNYDRRAT